MFSVATIRQHYSRYVSDKAAVWLSALLTAICAIALTLVVASAAQTVFERQLQQRFSWAASAHGTLLQVQVDERSKDLDGVRRFFSLSKVVTRSEFATYAKPLLQDALAVAWMPKVDGSQRQAFEARASAEMATRFRISQLDEHAKLIEASSRPSYFPLLYIESSRLASSPFGLDMASHPDRRQVLLRAFETGAPVASAVMQLIGPDSAYRSGLLLVAAVCPLRPAQPACEDLRGYVMVSLSLRELMEPAGKSDPQANLAVELYERVGDKSTLLYRSEARAAEESDLLYVRELTLGERHYQLSIRPTLAFVQANRSSALLVILAAGVLISVMLALLLYSIVSQRQRAQSLVRERTRELRERERELQFSEQRWSFALESTGDAVWDWDVETDRVYYSLAWKHMLGYAETDIGDDLEEWRSRVHPDDLGGCMQVLQQHFLGLLPMFRCEFRMLGKAGGWQWILARGKVMEWRADGTPKRVLGTHTDIAERKANELELARANGQLRGLLDAATQVSIIATDLNGQILTFNAGAERMLGYTAEQVVGKFTPEILHLPQELEERATELSHTLGHPVRGFETFILGCASKGQHSEGEWTYVRRDGSHISVNLIVTGVYDDAEQAIGYLGIAIDISESKKTREALQARDRLLDKLTRHIPGALFQFWQSPEGQSCFPYLSVGVGDVYELDAETLRGDAEAFFKRLHPDDLERVKASIQRSATLLKVWRDDYRVLLPRQGMRWVRSESTPERLGNGGVLWHGYSSDITGLKLVEEELRALSITDALTGAFNRRYFQERLEGEIARAQRREGSLALVMLDIDHFKQVNDRFGHAAGDQVLTLFCQRLSQRLRRIDVLCRLGGEEFIVLCPDTDQVQAMAVATALWQALRSEPVEGVGTVTASFGVAGWELGESGDSLLRRVDDAVYVAKKAGRDRVQAAVPRG
ncbi:MAG: GGDEF domain-containing protein [Pseudomonas sp. PGPPP3]|nr:MAG: GGDEF domain-containing protein [Pseudomonas sp. PGPPP3]